MESVSAETLLFRALHRLAQRYRHRRAKTPREDFLIINAPEVTLQHALLNVDMKEVMRTIFEVCDVAPDSRSKPLIAVFTGMGRGKTRLVAEVDTEIETTPELAASTLSLAITFNHKWNDIYLLRSNDKNKIPAVEYAFAIVARVFSMYFRVPLREVHVDLKVALEGVSDADLEKHCEQVIQESVRVVVRHCRESGGRPITRVVFSVDESVKAENALGANVHNVLRTALLNERLLSDLKVALVMTTVELKTLGATNSDRVVLTLAAPSVSLHPDDVLTHWLSVYVPTVDVGALEKEQRLALLSLIATLHSLPRGIQLLVQSIGDISSRDQEQGKVFQLDRKTLKEVHDLTFQRLQEHYALPNVGISLSCLRALLFGEQVRVSDVEVQRLLIYSVFTNTVSKISDEKYTMIAPQTCAMSLRIALESSGSQTSAVLRDTMQSLLDSLQDPKTKQGNALEVIARGLVEARLMALSELACQEKANKQVTLKDLLQVGPLDQIRNRTEHVIQLLTTVCEVNARRGLETTLSRGNLQKNHGEPTCSSINCFVFNLCMIRNPRGCREGVHQRYE